MRDWQNRSSDLFFFFFFWFGNPYLLILKPNSKLCTRCPGLWPCGHGCTCWRLACLSGSILLAKTLSTSKDCTGDRHQIRGNQEKPKFLRRRRWAPQPVQCQIPVTGFSLLLLGRILGALVLHEMTIPVTLVSSHNVVKMAGWRSHPKQGVCLGGPS